MRRLSAALIATLVSTPAALAQHVEWIGTFCIVEANQTCTANGWNVGSCFASRYTEPNVGDDGPITSISLFERTYAVNFTSATGIVGTNFQPVNATKVGSRGFQFTSQMRVVTERPFPVIATTPMIRSFGDINGWDGISDCNIGFRAAHTLCPQTFC